MDTTVAPNTMPCPCRNRSEPAPAGSRADAETDPDPDPVAWTQADQEKLIKRIPSFYGYLTLIARSLTARDHTPVDRPSDLVQKTVMAALNNVANGYFPEGRDNTLKPWLRGIMLRLHHRSFKKTPLQYGLTADTIPADASSPSSKADMKFAVTRLASAYAVLGSEDRMLLHWKNTENLTYDAIARNLRISTTSAYKKYHRAVDRLKTAFENGNA